MSNEKVSDSELDAALAGEPVSPVEVSATETPEETPKALEVPEETTETAAAGADEHRESSRLGRKVRDLTDNMTAVTSTLERLTTMLTKEEATTAVPAEPVDEDMPLTLGEVKKYMAAEEQRKVAAVDQYNTSFVQFLAESSKDMAEEDIDNVMGEIEKLAVGNYTGDATRDAALCLSKVLLKANQSKGSANPLKGGGTTGPTGLSGSGKTESRPAPKFKLDQDCLDLIAGTGMSDEDVEKTLKGPADPRLAAGTMRMNDL